MSGDVGVWRGHKNDSIKIGEIFSSHNRTPNISFALSGTVIYISNITYISIYIRIFNACIQNAKRGKGSAQQLLENDCFETTNNRADLQTAEQTRADLSSFNKIPQGELREGQRLSAKSEY